MLALWKFRDANALMCGHQGLNHFARELPCTRQPKALLQGAI